MLEVAFLASHLLWMTTKVEIEKLFELITSHAAASINISNHGINVGCDANLVILAEKNIVEAIRNHNRPDIVISKGKQIDISNFIKIAEA